MKHCNNCNIDIDNAFNLCPYCGQELERQRPTQSSSTQSWQPDPNAHPGPSATGTSSEMMFEEADRNSVRINGMVVESTTHQYYQSKLTKVIQSLLHGEPYQLSHTTFVTVFRVQEHVARGFAEQARDITVYGNIHNLFSAGDDVTVIAYTIGNRYVARSIYNHSIDSPVTSQSSLIPAWLIRIKVILPLFILASLLWGILSSPMKIDDLIVSIFVRFWPLFLVVYGWKLVAKKLKKK